MVDKRKRNFTKKIALGSAGAVVATSAVSKALAIDDIASPNINKGIKQWRMVLTWPKVLPGLGKGAVRLAKRIERLSNGMLEVKVYGAGELVPALQCFDAVSSGTAEMAHCAPYYWLNKSKAAAFFCAVPGGLTAQEQNAWIYYGGGQKLWDKLYDQFGVRSFIAGNTGTQMGGWFKKELNSLDDFKGIKMRLPGLAGEVLNRLGGSAQNIAAAELFSSLQSGVIDATEWVAPWNDLALGFYKIAKHYYGPAFQEGGPSLELMLNKKAYNDLDKDLQRSIRAAAAAENDIMSAQYYANNLRSMEILKTKHKIEPKLYPKDIMRGLFKMSEEVVKDISTEDKISREIYESWSKFRTSSMAYSDFGEKGFLNARAYKNN